MWLFGGSHEEGSWNSFSDWIFFSEDSFATDVVWKIFLFLFFSKMAEETNWVFGEEDNSFLGIL